MLSNEVHIFDNEEDYLCNYSMLSDSFQVKLHSRDDTAKLNLERDDVAILDPDFFRSLGFRDLKRAVEALGLNENRILLHGYFDADEICYYLDNGFIDILPKPADMRIVKAKILKLNQGSYLPTDRTPTVLIVDDDEYERERLRKVLRDEYVIYDAESHEAAKSVINSCRPDVILLDIAIGRESGIELMRWINSEKIPAKVICVSGKNLASIKRAAFELGVVDYILKPYPLNILSRKVKNVLRK